MDYSVKFDGEYHVFSTEQEALKKAEKCIQDCLDDNNFWDDALLSSLSISKVIYKPVKANYIERPKDVDEDGYHEATDEWWNVEDSRCDYKMEAV